MSTDIALLDKTEITVETDHGQITLVIGKTSAGYTCALWSKDKPLGSGKFSSDANVLTKVAVVGPLLVMAKERLQATAQRYPDGLKVVVRVEHDGKKQEIPGRIPLDGNQLKQLLDLFEIVRQANTFFRR